MVLSGNAEQVGMRSDTASLIKEQIGAIRKVYDLLLERTGIDVPEIEALFPQYI